MVLRLLDRQEYCIALHSVNPDLDLRPRSRGERGRQLESNHVYADPGTRATGIQRNEIGTVIHDDAYGIGDPVSGVLIEQKTIRRRGSVWPEPGSQNTDHLRGKCGRFRG